MSPTNEERLAAAKAKLDAIEARRAARATTDAVDWAVRDAEREAAVAEALEAAIDKHGALGARVLVVHATYADGKVAGSVIVKVASTPEWDRFRARIDKAKGTELAATTEQLWRPNVVWPELPAVDRLVAELPFFSTLLGDAVGRLCGVRAEDIAGK